MSKLYSEMLSAWPRLRGSLYRLFPGLWMRRLGAGSSVYGSQRFHRPFMNIEIGLNSMIGHNIFWQVGRSAKVSAGDHFSINMNSMVVIAEGLSIGDNVAIAEMVSLRDAEHRFDPEYGVRGQGFNSAPIVIEDNCWIGRGAYIGPGSHIGRGSIVAAHSVVRGQYPAGSLIAGAPAVVKRSLRQAMDE